MHFWKCFNSLTWRLQIHHRSWSQSRRAQRRWGLLMRSFPAAARKRSGERQNEAHERWARKWTKRERFRPNPLYDFLLAWWYVYVLSSFHLVRVRVPPYKIIKIRYRDTTCCKTMGKSLNKPLLSISKKQWSIYRILISYRKNPLSLW